MTRPGAKALNKPLLIVGIDRKAAGLDSILSIDIRAEGCFSELAASASFKPLWPGSGLDQFEVRDPLEMGSVPCKQGQPVSESDPRNQTVSHPDFLPRTVKHAANIRGVSGGSTIKRQHAHALKQLACSMATLVFTSSTQKLETAHSRGLKLVFADEFCDLILHGLDTVKEVNEDICVGDDQRQLSLNSLAVRRNSSASLSESEPPSAKSFLRRFSRSPSPCRKVSIASASTPENPFSPRRDASASSALRCSGFISTVVLMPSFYMHVHARGVFSECASLSRTEDL